MSVTETARSVQQQVYMPKLSPEAQLAVFARALFRTGWDDFNVGHITYRQSDDTFLASPFELGWDEVTASDIIRIDENLNKLEGRWTLSPGLLLHSKFHKARPGVNVTVHHHPRYATIWSCAGRVPLPYDQRSAQIAAEDIVLYDEFQGDVGGHQAAQAAVAAIGDKDFALLRNHGAFVAADNIMQAFQRCIALEWRCQQAWMVEAMGGGDLGAVSPAGQAALKRSAVQYGAITRPMLWMWAVRRELRLDQSVLC